MSDNTLTNENLFIAFQALEQLSGKEAPILVSHKIARMMLKIRPEFELLQTIRQGIVNKYAVKDEQGNIITTKDVNGNEVPTSTDQKALDAEWKKLMDGTITVDVGSLSVTEFGENFEVLPVFLEILMKAGLLIE